ncbi:uracil-DNA glycosylase [Chitinimonas naiadis]
MGRRELILDELGLQPQWVRREVLAQIAAEPVAQAEVVNAVPSAPPVEAALPARAEPAIETAPARAHTPQIEVDTPPTRTTPGQAVLAQTAAPARPRAAEADVAANDPTLARRAADIAQMDWETLQASVASCTACSLCKSRNRTVFGVGNAEADWLVVGEAPGADEDRQGEPFVGQAGNLLDSMLASVDRSRSENVYILNTLKCRPPQNRNPTPEELSLCAPYLHRQVELIKPKVVFAVGRFAVQSLLGREASIASLRGRLHDYRGLPVVVSYHPAYLLRNMPDKLKAWQDLLLTRNTLAARQQQTDA